MECADEACLLIRRGDSPKSTEAESGDAIDVHRGLQDLGDRLALLRRGQSAVHDADQPVAGLLQESGRPFYRLRLSVAERETRAGQDQPCGETVASVQHAFSKPPVIGAFGLATRRLPPHSSPGATRWGSWHRCQPVASLVSPLDFAGTGCGTSHKGQ